MKYFHVHIYFDAKDLELAYSLGEQAHLTNFFNNIKIFEKPIGPHPKGMIEMHFIESSFATILNWVKLHRKEFSVLIHEDTGDDIKDHTDGILWLGKQLPIDFSFFELIQLHPELRIHPI